MISKFFLCCLLIAIFTAQGESIRVVEIPRFETTSSGNVTVQRSASMTIIRAPIGQPATVRLATFTKPDITKNVYALQGEIHYIDVGGDGYLEMWSTFPAASKGGVEQRYFSRTLAESGPLAKINGTGQRPFLLPFDRSGASGPPIALEINLILPKGGDVTLLKVELVEFSDSQNPFGPAKAASFPIWLFTGTGVLCAVVGTWLILRFRKQRLADELRRMAAMDTKI